MKGLVDNAVILPNTTGAVPWRIRSLDHTQDRSNGQVVIPMAIRAAPGIAPGDEGLMTLEGRRLRVVFVSSTRDLRSAFLNLHLEQMLRAERGCEP